MLHIDDLSEGSTYRLLEILRLLQTRSNWQGKQLADATGVTTRTLRRDIERIRSMGYAVTATKGRYGGYQLIASDALPPLMLDSAEAVAITVGLIAAAATGAVDTGVALAKLSQLIPAAARDEVAALTDHILPLSPRGPSVSVATVGSLSMACRDHLLVHFAYTAADSTESARAVEPHSVVVNSRVWYLVGFDRGKLAWRTFRLDRMRSLRTTDRVVEERALPGGNARTFVADALRSQRSWPRVGVKLAVSRRDWENYAGEWAKGCTDGPDGSTYWHITAPTINDVALQLMWIPATIEYTLDGPVTVIADIQAVGRRLTEATRGPQHGCRDAADAATDGCIR